MAPSDYQLRTQQAADLGQRGAQRAVAAASASDVPVDPSEALGYWNEMIDIARHQTGELIDQCRNATPPVPSTEIGSAPGISTDAARQRWRYYKG